MRITNLILSFMFLLFAAVQYNDPDPFIWICMYTYAAVMCLLAGLGRYYKILLIAGALISFVWAISLAASIFLAFKNYGAGSLISFSMIKDTEVEEARESLGLIIVSSILLWKYWEGKKKLSY